VDWIVVAEKANSGAKTQQKRRANKFMANFYSKISKVSKLYENEKQKSRPSPTIFRFPPPFDRGFSFCGVTTWACPCTMPCQSCRPGFCGIDMGPLVGSWTALYSIMW